MKRSEEIQQKAREEAWYIADTSQTKEEATIRGYCLGVAYADRTMLEKVCEFFEPRLIAFIGREDAKEVITAFRQAMEGGAE